MTQLIRFGTAGQVWRPGELIVANRPRYPAPEPPPAPAARKVQKRAAAKKAAAEPKDEPDG